MQIMAFLFHSQVITRHRVLITRKCRLLTGVGWYSQIDVRVLITWKCRLLTGAVFGWVPALLVLIHQKCWLFDVR